jgi:hypothetical protein
LTANPSCLVPRAGTKLALVMRSILTSSHSHQPRRAPTGIHGVFKRPHLSAYRLAPREGAARTPPPAFLFPIQRCQRPDRLAGPTVRCPAAAKSGVCSRPDFPCQAVLFTQEPLRTPRP